MKDEKLHLVFSLLIVACLTPNKRTHGVAV